MKTTFWGLLILTILTSLFTKKYSEDSENIKRRLNYLQSTAKEITDGLIDYIFTPQTGIYCRAKEDIAPFETIFTIPDKNIISFCKKLNQKKINLPIFKIFKFFLIF